MKRTAALTGRQLHPCTNLVDATSVAEEEQTEAADGAHNQQEGNAHKEHGGLERSRGNGAKVQGASFADQFSGDGVANTVVEQSKITRLRSIHTVSNPIRLDEDHHGDDSEADGEYDPEHTDGPGITHIIGVVNFGSLLGW